MIRFLIQKRNPASLFFIVAFFFLPYSMRAQKADSIPYHAAQLRLLLDRAQHMTPAETAGYNEDYSTQTDSVDMNAKILEQLTVILTSPAIVQYNLDSLLRHEMLQICFSDDKRLWIFSWYENTGGTFRSYVSVIHYRTASNQPRVFSSYQPESQEDLISSYGASFHQVSKLRTKNSNLYVCLGLVIGCSTCCSELASVIELKNDTINLSYPAFRGDLEGQTSPTFDLESRCGDIETFSFNPKKQTLTYSYIPDDLTPVKDANNHARQKKVLRFNGIMFTE